MTYQVSLGCQ